MRRASFRLIALSLVLASAATLTACGADPSGGTEDARTRAAAAGPRPDRPGPFAVGRDTYTVPNAGQPGRTLTVDVWYPADPSRAEGARTAGYTVIPGVVIPARNAYSGLPVSTKGPFPLVVYSHGSGGLRFVSSFLTETLASHGFVVIAADHTGNTALDGVTGQTVGRAQNEINRLSDVTAIIDDALARSTGGGDLLSGSIRTDAIGVIGHSYGGFTALATPTGHRGVAANAKVRAVVGLAPYTIPMSDAELERLDVPTMLISGTKDTTTTIEDNTERPWELIPGRPLYRVDLENAAHHSFDDVCYYQSLKSQFPDAPEILVTTVEEYAKTGCAPGLMPIGRANRLIEEYTVAFLLTQLAGQPAYEAYLTPEFAAGQPGVQFSVETAE